MVVKDAICLHVEDRLAPRLPALTAQEILAVPGRHGCSEGRQSGGHFVRRYAGEAAAPTPGPGGGPSARRLAPDKFLLGGPQFRAHGLELAFDELPACPGLDTACRILHHAGIEREQGTKHDGNRSMRHRELHTSASNPPAMDPIRIAVSGAAGRMGRTVVRTVFGEPDMQVVAALDLEPAAGRDAGEIAGTARMGVPVTADLAEVIAARPDVLVEFATGRAVVEHIRAALESGIRPVVGSTGMTMEDIQSLGALAGARKVGAVIAPNFAIGAVLMMEFARAAARFLPHVEIAELHHDRKRDAPSGTAVKTARLIAEARGAAPAPAVAEEEMVAGARGGLVEGVRVHSVRLPGLGAHQEVIFGGVGQTLRIRHDSIGEESFMPGLLLAIRRVRELNGLVYGLEHLLGLR